MVESTSTVMSPALYLAPTSLLLLLLLLHVRRGEVALEQKSSHRKHLLRNIKHILHPVHSPLQTLLLERACANKRLVRALALSNTFVSADQEVHSAFVMHARRLLNDAQRNGWFHFQCIAREAIQWQLQFQETHPSVYAEHPFDKVIQNVTLYIVLRGILQIENVASSLYGDVDFVASSITKLWALSKKTEPIPPHLLVELQTHVGHLIPDQEAFRAPLDFIVPTWETLWRVVATTVAYSHDSDEIQQAFQAFNVCPKDETFREAGEGGAPNVKSVVTEALRLNPPSKRIGRSKVANWCPSVLAAWIPRTIVKADVVEALLHSDIWGPDARSFLPIRHSSNPPAEQREAMSFVFGHGPLRCIAASWAPMAAAVIAGVVLDEYIVIPGKDIGERDGWDGWRLKRRDLRL